MIRALTLYNTLNLEKRSITKDLKVVALASVIKQLTKATKSKVLLLESNRGNGIKYKEKANNKWKYEAPNDDDLKVKVVNRRTFKFCSHKYNNGNGMQTICKPEDHKSIVF